VSCVFCLSPSGVIARLFRLFLFVALFFRFLPWPVSESHGGFVFELPYSVASRCRVGGGVSVGGVWVREVAPFHVE